MERMTSENSARTSRNRRISKVSRPMLQIVTAAVLLILLQFFAGLGLIPSAMAQAPATVVLAGTGPTPHLQTVLDGVSDLLSSKGVKVQVPSGESKARVVVLEDMKKSGYSNLLYLTVNQVKGQRGKILAECFVNGSKAWEEYVRGSFMAVSAEGEVSSMLKAINKKIEKHIGRQGLPQ